MIRTLMSYRFGGCHSPVGLPGSGDRGKNLAVGQGQDRNRLRPYLCKWVCQMPGFVETA